MSKVLYAIPALNGKLSAHFGHCKNFVVIETEKNVITKEYALDPPDHVPGAYPSFLASHGVNFIIAGGMGQRAIDIFTQNGITVIMGANSIEPKILVQSHLDDLLESGDNSCNSDHHGNEGDFERNH